jgi:hypothetical protein
MHKAKIGPTAISKTFGERLSEKKINFTAKWDKGSLAI